jgi:predicted RNA-binding Zn ribbon-like protein
MRGLDVLPTFSFDGGRVCLDFAGTLGDRDNRSTERLRSLEDLGRWFVEAGLAQQPPATSTAKLNRARELREVIYRLVRAAMAGQPPDHGDVTLLNAAARHAPLVPQLDPGARRFRWRAGSDSAALAVVARDAIDLLASGQIQRVRECAAPDCSLLFVDESRPGARRWCSMARCGNRVKASAAYRRRRQSA